MKMLAFGCLFWALRPLPDYENSDFFIQILHKHISNFIA